MWKKNVKELFQHSNTQHADHSSFQSDVWRLRWQLETFWWLDETAWGRYRKYHKIFSSLPYLRDRHNRFEFNYMIDPATTAWFRENQRSAFCRQQTRSSLNCRKQNLGEKSINLPKIITSFRRSTYVWREEMARFLNYYITFPPIESERASLKSKEMTPDCDDEWSALRFDFSLFFLLFTNAPCLLLLLICSQTSMTFIHKVSLELCNRNKKKFACISWTLGLSWRGEKLFGVSREFQWTIEEVVHSSRNYDSVEALELTAKNERFASSRYGHQILTCCHGQQRHEAQKSVHFCGREIFLKQFALFH